MCPEDCNDAADDDVVGTSGDDIGGVVHDDGVFICCDDPEGASLDGGGAICVDDGATIVYDDPTGASIDGGGIVGEGIPPKCKPC